MADRLYHYTERLSAADILRAGAIRAAAQVLHRDPLARDPGRPTPPLVWLTADPVADGTILAKMRLAGWPVPPVGDLVRFAAAGDYPAAVPLSETAPTLGIEPAWWDWVVRTGALAGSRWEDWRLCPADVPAADWLAVEVLAAVDAGGRPTWGPWVPGVSPC